MNFYKKALSPELIRRAFEESTRKLRGEKHSYNQAVMLANTPQRGWAPGSFDANRDKIKARLERKIRQNNFFRRETQRRGPSESLVPIEYYNPSKSTSLDISGPKNGKEQNISKSFDSPTPIETPIQKNISIPKEQNINKSLDTPKPTETPTIQPAIDTPASNKGFWKTPSWKRNAAIGGIGLGAGALGMYLWNRNKKKKALQKSAATGFGLATRAAQYGLKGIGSRISQGFSKFTGNTANAAKAGNLATQRFQRAGSLFNQAKQVNPNIKRHLGLGAVGTGLVGAGMYGALSNNNQN